MDKCWLQLSQQLSTLVLQSDDDGLAASLGGLNLAPSQAEAQVSQNATRRTCIPYKLRHVQEESKISYAYCVEVVACGLGLHVSLTAVHNLKRIQEHDIIISSQLCVACSPMHQGC